MSRSATDDAAVRVNGKTQGVALRPETVEDADFLRRLYVSVRWNELALSNWPDEAKRAFLCSQFQQQTRQYAANYPGMKRCIVEHAGAPIGRLYLLTTETEMRVVDISLLAGWRGRGIGCALLRQAGRNAGLIGKPLRLHVEQRNPALRLYRRLGFEVIDDRGAYWLMEGWFNGGT